MDDETWLGYKKFILAELTRHDVNIGDLSKSLTGVTLEMSSLKQEIVALKNTIVDDVAELREFNKMSAGKSKAINVALITGVFALITTLVQGIISLLTK